jgi:hypothetical protein
MRSAEDSGIEVWVYGGTMLGALRSHSFAGRPNDIDLLVCIEDIPEYLGVLTTNLRCTSRGLRYLARVGLVHVHVWQRPHVNNRWFVGLRFGSQSPTIGVVKIEVMGLTKKSAHQTSVGEFPGVVNQGQPVVLPWSDFSMPLETSVYGIIIRVPGSAEQYLERIYGPRWMIPLDARAWLSEARFVFRDPKGFAD